MEDPCHSGHETRCVCETKEQRQPVVGGVTKLGSRPRHVGADGAQVRRPEVAWKTCQRRYLRSHKPVSSATDGRSRSTAELDHRKSTDTGSENCTDTRQPGDRKSVSTNVGNLAALSQAEESILNTPIGLADVKIQHPKVQLKTYQQRYPGSCKDTCKETDGRSVSSVEHGHQSQKLTGIDSKNGTVTKQPDDRDSIDANVRNLAALSTSKETVSVAPTAGKSCHAQAKPVKKNNKDAAASRKGGSNIPQATRHFPEAVRNGWTKPPPTGFKQVWRPKEKSELPKESPQLPSNASKEKDKRQNSRHSSKPSTSKKHKHRRRSKQNGRFQTVVLNDGTNQPVGHSCGLCGNDLSYSPTSRLADPLFHSCNFPDVAILLCGHVFHMQCMEHNMSEEQLKDPQCFLCDNPSVSSVSTCAS